MKRRLALALAVLASVATAPTQAQFQKPEDAIRYRQSAMVLMNNHLGRLAAMVNGRAPFDAKAAADSATLIETLSRLPFAAFVPGTDKGHTKADPAIWTEADTFKAKSVKMQDEAAKLAAAARSGSLDQIKPAVGAVGQACKSCHDDYRKQ